MCLADLWWPHQTCTVPALSFVCHAAAVLVRSLRACLACLLPTIAPCSLTTCRPLLPSLPHRVMLAYFCSPFCANAVATACHRSPSQRPKWFAGRLQLAGITAAGVALKDPDTDEDVPAMPAVRGVLLDLLERDLREASNSSEANALYVSLAKSCNSTVTGWVEQDVRLVPVFREPYVELPDRAWGGDEEE